MKIPDNGFGNCSSWGRRRIGGLLLAWGFGQQAMDLSRHLVQVGGGGGGFHYVTLLTSGSSLRNGMLPHLRTRAWV